MRRYDCLLLSFIYNTMKERIKAIAYSCGRTKAASLASDTQHELDFPFETLLWKPVKIYVVCNFFFVFWQGCGCAGANLPEISIFQNTIASSISCLWSLEDLNTQPEAVWVIFYRQKLVTEPLRCLLVQIWEALFVNIEIIRFLMR